MTLPPPTEAAADQPGSWVRVRVPEGSAVLLDALAGLDLVEIASDGVSTRTASRHSRHARPLDRLTPREREVLALMAAGRSNAGIAAALVLSDSAVAKHINSIFTKLDIPPADTDNRRVLAVLAHLHANRERRVDRS